MLTGLASNLHCAIPHAQGRAWAAARLACRTHPRQTGWKVVSPRAPTRAPLTRGGRTPAHTNKNQQQQPHWGRGWRAKAIPNTKTKK